jgi:hypothetical protein
MAAVRKQCQAVCQQPADEFQKHDTDGDRQGRNQRFFIAGPDCAMMMPAMIVMMTVMMTVMMSMMMSVMMSVMVSMPVVMPVMIVNVGHFRFLLSDCF